MALLHSEGCMVSAAPDAVKGSPFVFATPLRLHSFAMEKAQLKAKEERRLLRGHLWAYRNEFAGLPAVEDGEVVVVPPEPPMNHPAL